MSFNSRAKKHLQLLLEIGEREQWTNNLVTTRPPTFYDAMPGVPPSATTLEAAMKARRLFKRICRLMPYLLDVHSLRGTLTPFEACQNVALGFRHQQHLRDPGQIDRLVTVGYVSLHDAQFLLTDHAHVRQQLCPDEFHSKVSGRSTFDEVQARGRSRFLTGFYSKANLY